VTGHDAGCPSGLELAQLAAGDLDGAREAAVAVHAAPCRRCAERLREIEEAREELFGRDPNAIATAARFIAEELAARADDPSVERDAWFEDRFDH
jgi:anti-sigma factor ChrR (cupin superfamily)